MSEVSLEEFRKGVKENFKKNKGVSRTFERAVFNSLKKDLSQNDKLGVKDGRGK